MRVDFVQILATLALLVLVLKSVRENKFTKMIKSEHIMMLILSLFVLNPLMRKNDAIEFYDGSQTAFDKEAFINLNRVVSELAGSGNLTIPGNLTVSGNLHMGTSKIPSISKDNYAIVKKLKVGSVADPGDGEITAKTGFFGTADTTKMRITDRNIGNKTAGDIKFCDDKWKRCIEYAPIPPKNLDKLVVGVAGTDSYVGGTLWVKGNMDVVGSATAQDLTVKNNATITNNLTVKNNTTITNDITANNLTVKNNATITKDLIATTIGSRYPSSKITTKHLQVNQNSTFGVETGGVHEFRGSLKGHLKNPIIMTSGLNVHDPIIAKKGIEITGHNIKNDYLTLKNYGQDQAIHVWRKVKDHRGHAYLMNREFNQNHKPYKVKYANIDGKPLSSKFVVQSGRNNDYNDWKTYPAN